MIFSCRDNKINAFTVSLGLLSSTPSHTPSENDVWPMNFTTPNSPLTNTFMPVSRVTSGREEGERGAAEEEEWGAGWGVGAVRGCLARGADLWGGGGGILYLGYSL